MNLLPLESVLPKKVYLNNTIIGRQRDASFVVGKRGYRFGFTFPFSEYKPTVFFKIQLSDHILWLSLEEIPPLAYFSEKFESVNLEEIPEDIRPIVLEACFKNVLDIIEEELGVIISIEGYFREHPGNEFEDELQFAVEIDGVGGVIRGALHMEGSSLEFLAAILERSSYSRTNRFPSFEIPVRVVIGEESLTLSEFRGLNLRDIILLKDPNYSSTGVCRVVVGDYLIYTGIFKSGKVTLQNLMDERIKDEDVSGSDTYEIEEEVVEEGGRGGEGEHEEEMEEHGEFSKEVSDLPIQVVFEVGQKRLALKELQSLKAGYTFELESSVERPVTIRANGRVIGTGELLKVGERIGVRVTSFAKK